MKRFHLLLRIASLLIFAASVKGEDLTIGYIQRLPEMDYIWNSANPSLEGWPAIGQQITWRANIKNWFDTTVQAVSYRWMLDGIEIASGTVNMQAEAWATVDFNWIWTFERHILTFEIDTNNDITESEEQNNSVSLFTDAITVGLYVEQSVYDYFKDYQHLLGDHSNCWEDWAHRQVDYWNQFFTEAIYSDAPEGVLDRIRLDKITVVPDGALPLAWGYPTNNPNMNDRTVDLQWGFPATLLEGTLYSDHYAVSFNNPFYYEGSLLHELGHARYLIDVYGFNVHDDGSGNTVAITENGALIVGTEFMPFIAWDAVFYSQFQGLMNGTYTYIDEYSTSALNLIEGHRATQGNYNAPNNIGSFLNDLPAENVITIKDNNSSLLTGADVQFYQAAGQAGVWYGKYYDDIPDLYFNSDENGKIYVGQNPFSSGDIQHTYELANGVVIVRVILSDYVGYTFLESSLFNMEYWRSNTDLGEYELTFDLQPIGIKPEVDSPTLPHTTVISYPNPFNTQVKFDVSVSRTDEYRLRIYNLSGSSIDILHAGRLLSGSYNFTWRPMNIAAGLYFYQLSSPQQTRTGKLLYLK